MGFFDDAEEDEEPEPVDSDFHMSGAYPDSLDSFDPNDQSGEQMSSISDDQSIDQSEPVLHSRLTGLY